MDRRLVVVGALVIQVSLGAVYIWSVFQTPLQAAFPSWSEKDVTLPAQLVLVFFALAVIFGGRLQDKIGPSRVATAGGIVLGTGLLLAALTEKFGPETGLIWLILSFSVLGGIGIGAAYVCPIAACVKWYPDKRGLITGLAVAGFGAGAFFFAPLAKALISGDRYRILGLDLFGLPRLGVFNAFAALGVLFLVAIVAGSRLLRNPPPGYAPPGDARLREAPCSGAVPVKTDFSPREMLRTGRFWLLWLAFFAGCAAGLQVIMKASPIWQSFRLGSMAAPVAEADFNAVAAAGATAVAVLAIFNSLGRILWGKLSDGLGRRTTLFLMFALCGAVMLALDSLRAFPLYLAGVCVVGLCFGGFLALYPAVTADSYGTKHIGANYGWMFSAYGAGGFFGPYLAAWLMKAEDRIPYLTRDGAGALVEKSFVPGNYRSAFIISGLACLAAAALVAVALRKK